MICESSDVRKFLKNRNSKVSQRVSCFNGCVFGEVQLCLVVVSIVVLSQAILCPVVREW